jgi:hypothetical protein
MTTTAHAMASNKANDFIHLRLINMVRFAYYSKYAKVSKQILLNIKP